MRGRGVAAPWGVPLFALVVACGGGDGDGSTTDTVGEDASVTYWQDVAPIFYNRCVTCHQAGGIGPFRLDDYAEAKQWAPASAAAVEARTMPPWLVTDDGSCGSFEGSRALAPAEIEAIRAWTDAGAPEGEPRTDLVAPEVEVLTDAVTYETPSFVPEAEGGDLSAFDEYRCFRVQTGLTEDRFLTAYSVEPGVPEMIHHVLVITVDPEAQGAGGVKNKDIMEALDAESPDRDGWPCFGAAGDGVQPRGIPVSWAPGQGISHLPEGTGYRISKDDWVIMQVHYNLTNEALDGLEDQTAVHIRYADSVEREGHFFLPDDLLSSLQSGDPVQLAPGEASVTYSFDFEPGNFLKFHGAESGELHGIFPHMHQYGRKQRVELIEGDGGSQCVSDVQRWDFDWQLYYFYQQPLPLTQDSKLRITCDYDTRSAKDPVLPGWGTNNEMCLAGVFIVPDL
ncbi:monooxygenase [Nannocystis punicea]|uniref:Copper type II ascorbate-dependent monooxygenase C-terminal domain-containing protein n=1 Tax=Nannocystis punicea TaxID=2995304 RepID=A0ABY7HGD3_9BACT|nr:hypothetical protein [Nannocystis poenicansa]WAS98044.1 hypothetical protein O0S08_18030 [Nannocystis poenicansa]